MNVLIAIAVLGGLGLIFGLVLAAASKVFYVETDPRLDIEDLGGGGQHQTKNQAQTAQNCNRN